MVLNCGVSCKHQANWSVISRSDGRGGKMYVPRAMYSLRMSFWIVPPMSESATLCFFAAAA